jgi:hypothetical protein
MLATSGVAAEQPRSPEADTKDGGRNECGWNCVPRKSVMAAMNCNTTPLATNLLGDLSNRQTALDPSVSEVARETGLTRQ